MVINTWRRCPIRLLALSAPFGSPQSPLWTWPHSPSPLPPHCSPILSPIDSPNSHHTRITQ